MPRLNAMAPPPVCLRLRTPRRISATPHTSRIQTKGAGSHVRHTAGQATASRRNETNARSALVVGAGVSVMGTA